MQLFKVFTGLLAIGSVVAFNLARSEERPPLTRLTSTSSSATAQISACCGDVDEGYYYPCGSPDPSTAWSCTLDSTSTCSGLSATSTCFDAAPSTPAFAPTTTTMTDHIASPSTTAASSVMPACCGDIDEGYYYPCATPEPTAAWSCTVLSSTCSGDRATSTCIAPRTAALVVRQATRTSPAAVTGSQTANASAAPSTLVSVASSASLSSYSTPSPLNITSNSTALNTTDHAVVPKPHEQSCTMEDREINEGHYTINIGFTWDDAATKTCTKLYDGLENICKLVHSFTWRCNPNTGKGYATLGFDCGFGHGDYINTFLNGIFPEGDLMYTGFNCPNY